MNGIQENQKLESVQSVIAPIGTKTERSDFYVYVYLDPRKPGSYKYGKYKFQFEPFYVGKGTRDRLHPRKHRSTLPCGNKISKIESEGFDVFTQTIVGLTEEQAFSLEKRLIKTIGRFKDNGPLQNLTIGGEGFVGGTHSDATKERLRAINLGKKLPESTLQKLRIAAKRPRKPRSEETKRKLALNFGERVGRRHSEETKKKMSLSRANIPLPKEFDRTGISPSVETRIKISEGVKRTIQKRKDSLWEKRRS